MNVEKLEKQREKHRQKLIKKFGNAILKCSTYEELKFVERDVVDWQKDYILGAGSRSWTMGYSRYSNASFRRLKEYMESLPYIQEFVIDTLATNKEEKHHITIKYVVPTHETEIGERYHKDYKPST